VRILDDFSVGLRENVPPGVTIVEGDVRQADLCRQACQSVDTVFHLAARVTIRQSVETFFEDAQTNLMGTLTLLRAASAAQARRFIFASSMGVYADSPDGAPVSEAHPTEPLSPYGISKLAAEKYALMMGPILGLEPVALRFFNTYGTRQGYSPYVGVTTIFLTNILKGKPCTIFGDGNQCRDFVHVSDIAAACALAADAPQAVGQVMNVGSGIGTTVNQLAALIKACLGKGDFVYAERDTMELLHSVADITKAKTLLGYEPRGALEARLPELVEYVRGRTNGPNQKKRERSPT